MNDCLIKDRPKDVSWLCSLSKSEIDMLMNLKKYIHHRAKMIGHEELAEKFDLRVLRAIAFVAMEHLKEKLKDSSLTLDVVKPSFDACNLLRCDHEGAISVEDLSKNIGIDPQRILFKGPQEEVGSSTPEVGSELQRKRKRKGFFVGKKAKKLKTVNNRIY